MSKKVLIACEESQAVTIEMRKLGLEAYSCDIIDCSGDHPEWHIKEDVLPLLNGNCKFKTVDGQEHEICGRWDMIIAFPPCTHLAVSGAPSFAKKREDGRQREGIIFFAQMLNADCDKVVVENPINIIGGEYIQKWFPDLCEQYGFPRKCTQKIHPWMFGDNFSKSTCLWIKGLPALVPEVTVEPELEYVEWVNKKTGKTTRQPKWYYDAFMQCRNNDERSKIRSKTFPGIARAMAEQWGKILLDPCPNCAECDLAGHCSAQWVPM